MRQSQKSNRSRGRGNRNKGGGGGNNLNRVYDSAGPEGKVRGTPQQIIDKYLTLARDAQTSGDRVTAENFLQHAEHYQRILIAATSEQERIRRENSQNQNDEQPEVAQPDAMSVAEEAQTGGGNGKARGDRPQPQAEEIGGMTTIDAGSSEPESLVVASEESSQPRQTGNRRRARPKPAPDAEATEKPAPTAEAAEG